MLRGEGQKIVHKLMNEVSTQSSNRRPDFYLKFLQVKCFFLVKNVLDANFFPRACGLSRRSPFCIASTRRGWRRSSIFRRPVRSKSTLFRWPTVVSILKHDWFDIISKIDFQYVRNPSFPLKKHSHHLLSQTKMAIHDIVATTYYLENYDRSKINLEVTKHKNCLHFFLNGIFEQCFQALVVQDCHLNDDALKVFGSRVSPIIIDHG